MGKKISCGSELEHAAWRAGYRRIAGVDEAGRGALFGPVVAAAVILDPKRLPNGLRDSKQLPARERERLGREILRCALAWASAQVEADEIDRINIYQASRLAMQQAVVRLKPPPDLLLTDALRLALETPQIPLLQGDARCISIAAASILAKVERDALMLEWDRTFPQYHLRSHKGYATPLHLATLAAHGPTPYHRCSYKPVAAVKQRS